MELFKPTYRTKEDLYIQINSFSDYIIEYNPIKDNFKIIDSYKNRIIFQDWSFHKRKEIVRKELQIRFYRKTEKKSLSWSMSEYDVYLAYYKIPNPNSDRVYWTEEIVLNYLHFNYLNTPPPDFSMLGKGLQGFIGTKTKYDELLKKIGIELNYKFKDKYNNFLKSNLEFIFSCLCELNNIEYIYEKKVTKNIISDFYLVNMDIYVEIAGMMGMKNDKWGYNNKIMIKERTYKDLGLNAFFIKNTSYTTNIEKIKDFFNSFGLNTNVNLDIFYSKYQYKYNDFINELTESLTKLNDCVKPNVSQWIANNSIFNRHIKDLGLDTYSAIKKYVGQPNRNIRIGYSQSEYFSNYENVKFECDYVKEILGYQPSQGETNKLHLIDKRLTKYKEMFRHCKSHDFCFGGKYYGLIDYYVNIIPDGRQLKNRTK
jgi:hypothetical protein